MCLFWLCSGAIIIFTCSHGVKDESVGVADEHEAEEMHEKFNEELSEHLLGDMFELEDEEPKLWPNIYGESVLRLCKYLDLEADKRGMAAFKELMASFLLLIINYVVIGLLFSIAYQAVIELREEKTRRQQMMRMMDTKEFVNRDWAAFMSNKMVLSSGDKDNHQPIWNLVADIKFCTKTLTDIVPYWNAMDEWFMVATCAVFFIFYAKVLQEMRENWDMFTQLSIPFEGGKMVHSHGDLIHIKGYTGECKLAMFFMVFLPKLCVAVGIAIIGSFYLLANSVSSDLQELLISTIELMFLLEVDEIFFESFTNVMKKEELEKTKLPRVTVTSSGVKWISLTEFLGCVFCISMMFALLFGTFDARLNLTAHNQQVIEGCCNLENFLNGRGKWEIMRYENECREFREKYFFNTVEKDGWDKRWEQDESHVTVSVAAR